ncbi:hypothetical protein [Arcobacter sp. AHV-9/2010]|nr:hypothetical protein [Arcobacter sp. CECT 9299]
MEILANSAKYNLSCSSNDIPRAVFSLRELADITINFTKEII